MNEKGDEASWNDVYSRHQLGMGDARVFDFLLLMIAVRFDPTFKSHVFCWFLDRKNMLQGCPTQEVLVQ